MRILLAPEPKGALWCQVQYRAQPLVTFLSPEAHVLTQGSWNPELFWRNHHQWWKPALKLWEDLPLLVPSTRLGQDGAGSYLARWKPLPPNYPDSSWILLSKENKAQAYTFFSVLTVVQISLTFTKILSSEMCWVRWSFELSVSSHWHQWWGDCWWHMPCLPILKGSKVTFPKWGTTENSALVLQSGTSCCVMLDSPPNLSDHGFPHL